MDVLAAAVVIVGAIAALNLLLTFGVICRLREHTDLLAGGAATGPPTMIAVGESVAPFTAAAVDGGVVSLDRMDDRTLVGVFGVGCSACEEKLPIFVTHAASFPGGRQAVLALVVADDDTAAAPYVDALAEVAVVVREAEGGAVSTALGVRGYPTFAMVEAGVVRANALNPTRLPMPDATG